MEIELSASIAAQEFRDKNFNRPYGTITFLIPFFPPMNRWAIVKRSRTGANENSPRLQSGDLSDTSNKVP